MNQQKAHCQGKKEEKELYFKKNSIDLHNAIPLLVTFNCCGHHKSINNTKENGFL